MNTQGQNDKSRGASQIRSDLKKELIWLAKKTDLAGGGASQISFINKTDLAARAASQISFNKKTALAGRGASQISNINKTDLADLAGRGVIWTSTINQTDITDLAGRGPAGSVLLKKLIRLVEAQPDQSY